MRCEPDSDQLRLFPDGFNVQTLVRSVGESERCETMRNRLFAGSRVTESSRQVCVKCGVARLATKHCERGGDCLDSAQHAA